MESIDILKQINQEKLDFENRFIQIVPNFLFNQRDALEKIYFYYNSKFKTGEVDAEGDRKYFYNISKNPCKVYTKAIDFDTKNFRFFTVEGGDTLKTWFVERDFKYWMRDKNFGKVLNRIFTELPIYGSVVLKIVEGVPQFVDLRNFIVDQSADDLDCSNYIIEIHQYTPIEFEKVAQQMKWSQEKVDEAMKHFRETKGAKHMTVYERYGEVIKTDDKGERTYPYERVFIANAIPQQNYNVFSTIPNYGVLLSEEKWKSHPYWEFHLEKISGRWLGIGVVETLFEPQIRENELCNLQAKSSYWAALRVFQTRDAGFNRNLLSETRNGEVLNIEDNITQIDMSDRNLAFFNEETLKWMRNRDELTFSYDVIQGERLPAGTPLGSARLAITQTLSFFETVQENIALEVKEMIYKVILPQFEKDLTPEHTLRLIGQDLDAYIQMVKGMEVQKEIVKMVIKSAVGGKFPTEQDREILGIAIEEQMKKSKELLLPLPKDFYKNTKYEFDIDITGESLDSRVRYATKFAILQATTVDPNWQQDPFKKGLIFSMAEDGGLNLNNFIGQQTKEASEKITEIASQGRAGGGVSALRMPQAPVPGQAGITV